MRSTRLSLIPFAAALIVAAPAILSAPAFAQGSAGEWRYEAYLAQQTKIKAMQKAAGMSEQKVTVGTSEVGTFDESAPTNGGRRYLHAVPLDQEQHYRGN